MDYTCAWERTFGIELRTLPSWVRRRVGVNAFRRAGKLDLAMVVDLSRRVERARRATELNRTARLVRPARRAA